MRNLNTRLKCRKRGADPMHAYDTLPAPLRQWVAQAALPWSAPSVKRAWNRALARHDGDEAHALEYMTRAEARSLNKDAPRIWGACYPSLDVGCVSRAADR